MNIQDWFPLGLTGLISLQSKSQEGRKWRGTKEPLDEGQKWEWKSWLNVQKTFKKPLNIQKTKIMASSPITSELKGEKVKAVADFIFLGSKITEDGDHSHEVKTFASWKKSHDKPS